MSLLKSDEIDLIWPASVAFRPCLVLRDGEQTVSEIEELRRTRGRWSATCIVVAMAKNWRDGGRI